jgi:hypothetical protein
MFKTAAKCLLLVLLPFVTFAQKKAKVTSVGTITGLPKYILASNANPAVIIQFRSYLQQSSFEYNVSGYTIKNGKKEKAPKKQQDSIPEIVYDAFVKYLKADFDSLNIHPSVFINLDAEKNKAKSDLELDNNIRKTLFDNKSRYTINITISTWPDEDDVATAKQESFSRIVTSISKFRGGSAMHPGQEDFGTLFFTNNYESFKPTFKKSINAYNKEYYQLKMDETDYPTAFAEMKEYDTMPDDLDKEGLVIMVYNISGNMINDRNTNIALDKILKKQYPYKYKLIDRVDLPKYVNNGYKYVAEYKIVNNGEVPESTEGAEGIDASIYYTIRNPKTDDVYFGDKKDEVIKKSKKSPEKAIGIFIDRIKKQYKK